MEREHTPQHRSYRKRIVCFVRRLPQSLHVEAQRLNPDIFVPEKVIVAYTTLRLKAKKGYRRAVAKQK